MGSGLIDQVASGEAPPLVPFTVEQLHRMLEKGIIRDGDPIELLEGLLVRKNRALDSRGCHLRIQLPVTLSTISEPEPDLAIVKGSLESFSARHPGPDDLMVIVEVADSSLGYDRGAKLRAYASAGVPVYLIVNIPERHIECYENPLLGQGRYERRTDYRTGQTLLLPLAEGKALPLAVDDAFGSATP